MLKNMAGPVSIFGLPRATQNVTLEAARKQMWIQQHLLKRFAIVLVLDTEEPVFRPGSTITGRVRLKPRKNITITGLEVLFGGEHSATSLEDDRGRMWTGYELVFTEQKTILDTPTDLGTDLYVFNFSYILPDHLPPSVVTSHGKACYYVYGKVSTAETRVQSMDTAFHVVNTLDIGRLPNILHGPLDWPASLVFPLKKSEESEVVSAQICLNKRAFVPGEHVVVDVKVENETNCTVVCKLKFYKTTSSVTSAGGRARTREVSIKLDHSLKVRVKARSSETFSKMFDITPEMHDGPSFVRKCPHDREILWELSKMVLIINVQYNIELEVYHNLTKKAKSIYLPLVIGTEDSGKRLDVRENFNPQLIYVDFLGPDYYINSCEAPPPYAERQRHPDSPPPSYKDCAERK